MRNWMGMEDNDLMMTRKRVKMIEIVQRKKNPPRPFRSLENRERKRPKRGKSLDQSERNRREKNPRVGRSM